MWNERKMPKRWYELLRARMQVEEQRIRVVKDGYVIEDDHLQELLTEAHSLDREMLLVMRQAIAEALAREDVSRPGAAPGSIVFRRELQPRTGHANHAD
jgi:hypothetical protein